MHEESNDSQAVIRHSTRFRVRGGCSRAQQSWKRVQAFLHEGKLKQTTMIGASLKPTLSETNHLTTLSRSQRVDSSTSDSITSTRIPSLQLGRGLQIPGGADISTSLRRVYLDNSDTFAFYFSVDVISSPLFNDTLSVLYWLVVVDNFRHGAGVEYLAALFANFSYFFGIFSIYYEREYKLEVTLRSTPSASAHVSGLSSKNDWRSAFCELSCKTLRLAFEQTFPANLAEMSDVDLWKKIKTDVQIWVIGIPMSQFDVNNHVNSQQGKKEPTSGSMAIESDDVPATARDANLTFAAHLSSQQDGTSKTIRNRPTSAHKLAQTMGLRSRPSSPSAATLVSNMNLRLGSADTSRVRPPPGMTYTGVLEQVVETLSQTAFGMLAAEPSEQLSLAPKPLDAVGKVEEEIADEMRRNDEGGNFGREAYSTRHQAMQQMVTQEKMDYQASIAKIQFDAMVESERLRREKIAMIGKPIFAKDGNHDITTRGSNEASYTPAGDAVERFKQLKRYEYVPNKSSITERFGLDTSSPVMRIFLSFTVATTRSRFGAGRTTPHLLEQTNTHGNNSRSPSSAFALSTASTRQEGPVRDKKLLDLKRSSLLRDDENEWQSKSNNLFPNGALGCLSTSERNFIDYVTSLAEGRTTLRLTQERFRLRCEKNHDLIAVSRDLFRGQKETGHTKSETGRGEYFEHFVVTPENLDEYLSENKLVTCSIRNREAARTNETKRSKSSNSNECQILSVCSLCSARPTAYFCASCNGSICKDCRPAIGKISKQIGGDKFVNDISPSLIFGDELSQKVFAPEVHVETKSRLTESDFKSVDRSVRNPASQSNVSCNISNRPASATHSSSSILSRPPSAKGNPSAFNKAMLKGTPKSLGDYVFCASSRASPAPTRPSSALTIRPLSSKASWAIGTREIINGEEISLSKKLQSTSIQNRSIRESLLTETGNEEPVDAVRAQQQDNSFVRSGLKSSIVESGIASVSPSINIHERSLRSDIDVSGYRTIDMGELGGRSSILKVIRNRALNQALKEQQRMRLNQSSQPPSSLAKSEAESTPQQRVLGRGSALRPSSAPPGRTLSTIPTGATGSAGSLSGTASATVAAAADGILSNFASGGCAHKSAHGRSSASILWSPADEKTVTSFMRIREDIATRTRTALSRVARIKRSDTEAKQKTLQNEKSSYIAESKNYVEGIQRARELERILKKEQQRTVFSALDRATKIMEERFQRFNEAPPSIEHRHHFNQLILHEINHQKQNLVTLRDIMFDIPSSTHTLVHKFVCERRMYVSDLVLSFKSNNHDMQSLWPDGINDHYVTATAEEIQRLTVPYFSSSVSSSTVTSKRPSVVETPESVASRKAEKGDIYHLSATDLESKQKRSSKSEDDDPKSYGSYQNKTTKQPDITSKNLHNETISSTSSNLSRPQQIEAIMIPSDANRLKSAKYKQWGAIREFAFSHHSSAKPPKPVLAKASCYDETEHESTCTSKDFLELCPSERESVSTVDSLKGSSTISASACSEENTEQNLEEKIRRHAEHIRAVAGVSKTRVGNNIASVGGKMVWEDTGVQIGSSASTFLLTRRKSAH